MMTNNKALEGYENLLEEIDPDNHLFVGTINPDFIKTAIDAIKKQTPKKPYNSHYKQLHNEIKLHNCYRCVSCDHIVPYAQNYCGHCGQAIDWMEGE